jgi:hypothetical protein
MSFASDYDATQDSKKEESKIHRFWLPKNVGESVVYRLLPGFSRDPNISPDSVKPYAYYKVHKVEVMYAGQEKAYSRRFVSMTQNISREEREKFKAIKNVVVTQSNALDKSVREQVLDQIEELKKFCPLAALAKKNELIYFTKKAEGAPKEVLDALWRRMLDSNPKSIYLFNAVNKDGVVGLFEIGYTVFKKIENVLIPKAREKQLSIYSVGKNGVWIKFTRVSKGEKDNYSVELATVEREVDGEMLSAIDRSPIPEATLRDLGKLGVDIHHIYDKAMLSKQEAMQLFLEKPLIPRVQEKKSESRSAPIVEDHMMEEESMDDQEMSLTASSLPSTTTVTATKSVEDLFDL